jgi:hypothetical protein
VDKAVNYKGIFEKYLQQIKSARNPKSERPEMTDLEWNRVIQQVVFDFGGYEFSKYTGVVEAARAISIRCLHEIIYHLQAKNPQFNSIDYSSIKELFPNVCFVLQNLKTKELLIFKEVEDCGFWKMKGKEPKAVADFMDSVSAKSCKYVYLVYDCAYLQVIGHNDDESDPGRGYNLYSLKWFFETYYGTAEYACFLEELNVYLKAVNDYLGYILLKSLTPNAMLNFRKITEQKIVKYQYESLMARKAKEYELSNDAFELIKQQFVDESTYLVALGNSDFSESLITAEWLYDSMKKAQAIDLTVIGMGYFKAVEQLLYNLICLHANEGRKMKKDFSRKELPFMVELTDESIKDESVDTTIGAMANFYKDNLDMLRGDLNWHTKKYVRETIFDYGDLRNGYFHKDNIYDWSEIDTIRDATLSIIFLLLGSQKLSEQELTKLGMPAINEYSDYAKLCEFVNFHSGDLFFVDIGCETEELAFGCRDMHSKVVDNRYIQYSGMYLKNLGKEDRTVLFKEECLPKTIYLGKFVFAQTEGVSVTPVKVRKIFENGKFIGPSIIEEQSFDY